VARLRACLSEYARSQATHRQANALSLIAAAYALAQAGKLEAR